MTNLYSILVLFNLFYIIIKILFIYKNNNKINLILKNILLIKSFYINIISKFLVQN